MARMGHWEFDVAADMFLFNDQYYTMHGVTAQDVGGYQMTAEAFAARFVHPDNAHLVRDAVRTAVDSEDPDGEHLLEARILRVDGEARWVTVWFRWEKDGQGRAVRLYGVNQDITERKRAEQEMAILADIRRLIGSTLNIDEVYERFAAETKKLIPVDGLTINLYNFPENTAMYAAYVSGVDIEGRRQRDPLVREGSLSEAVIRTRTAHLIQPSDIDEAIGRFPRLAAVFQAGLRSLICVPLVYRDEAIGVLHFRSKKPNAYTRQDLRLAEKIGMQIAGAIANAQMFNYLSEAEKALRESEELFRTSMENAPDGVYINDLEGSFLYGNNKAEEMIGYRREELISGNFFTLNIIAGGSLDRAAELLKANQEGKATGPDELELIRKDGRHILVEISTTMLERKGKKDVLAFVRDITERRRAEEEKRSLEERLQRAEKMEVLGTLAGGVAHDMNNVLGVLSAYSELLLERIPKESRSRIYVDKILQSTEKGAAIIEDLLTLARRGVTVSDVINLNNVVSDFLKTPVFEKVKDHHPQVTFRADCDKDLLNIKGSPVHLEKTLMNLVSNAAEAIPGTGEVTIRTESRYLDKPVRGYEEIEEGDFTVLTVSDTGIGIPAVNREKIFEPFYTKKTMGRSGTGLGLAIVWGTVKDHNGYVDIQTEVGKGTTFTLYFPVTREELIAPQQKEPIERYMAKGESVLVVDDIAEQRDVAHKLLTRLGYDVHEVSSGEEAVEYLKKNKADILVLDMIMAPGIDGLETYKRVLEVNRKQKAIIISGFSETDRVRKAQKLGAGAYVKKPYVMEKIGVAIRDELNR